MHCRDAKSFISRFAVPLSFCAWIFVTPRAQAAAIEKLTNSLGMEFVRISPSVFSMTPSIEGPMNGYAGQQASTIRLSTSFYVLQGRVTDEMFKQSGLKGSANDASWNEAADFCAWLSRHDGRTYRLPTEAEWACASQELGPADFQGREWVNDWYENVPLDTFRDPAGPVTGLTKVIRAGPNRFSLSPDAKSSPWGLPKTSFRVVLVAEAPARPSFTPTPFNQSAVKQTPNHAGPNRKLPFFHVRFALPIPPENSPPGIGSMTGIDPSVMGHLHSPGFEILPNGDALAIFFSAKDSTGASECDTNTCFVQARLRYGA
jgi:hypothetical protein